MFYSLLSTPYPRVALQFLQEESIWQHMRLGAVASMAQSSFHGHISEPSALQIISALCIFHILTLHQSFERSGQIEVKDVLQTGNLVALLNCVGIHYATDIPPPPPPPPPKPASHCILHPPCSRTKSIDTQCS